MQSVARTNVIVVFAMLLSSVAGFAIALSMPWILSASEYTRFVTIWATGQFVASIAFEWMRFGVIRFANTAQVDEMRARRALLLRLYLLVSTLLLLGGVLSWGLLSGRFDLADEFFWVALFAVANGVFDGFQGLQRAEMRNAAFSSARIIRTFSGFFLAVLFGALWGSAGAVLIGLALSFPFTIVVVHFGARNPLPSWPNVKVQRSTFRFLALFGLMAAAGTNLTMLAPAMQRLIAVHAFGLENSAGIALGFDLSQKAIALTGLAINVVVMQKSIHSAEFGDETQQKQQLSLQISGTFAVVVPAAVGFYILSPDIAKLLVPDPLVSSFQAIILAATLTAGLLAIRMFSIDPIFLVKKRPHFGLIGPFFTGLSLVVIWLYPPNELVTFGWMMVGAASIGVLAACIAVFVIEGVEWPVNDLVKIILGSGIMYLLTILLISEQGFLPLIGKFSVAVFSYVSVAIILNTIGVRDTLTTWRTT